MNFATFQSWREQCLRTNPGLLDCAETNLYRSLAHLQSQLATLESAKTIHRCDLARLWLKRYGFPESHSRRALVCRGVRHALALIFKEIARTNASLCVPADVYPVYLDLARSAGIQPQLYPTLPEPKLPALASNGRVEYLLATNPWKPLGRFFSHQECAGLTAWLKASPNRHLLIDCVYDLGTPFHETTRTLQQTGRVTLLHSVTKGWLWPKTFGVSLLGEDNPQLESIFRNDPPSQEQLRLAEHCLGEQATLPSRVMEELGKRKQKFLSVLPGEIADSLLPDYVTSTEGCYFFPVALEAEDLLKHHRILAIPGTAFGANWPGSILTSLAGNFSATKIGDAS